MKALVFALLLCFGISSYANYAMDPNRKPDPAFTKFFLGRIDGWLRKNIYDYQSKMSATDRQFVEDFLRDPRSLGETVNGSFVVSYSYGVRFDDTATTYGPFRFVRPRATDADRAAFARVLKAHGVKSQEAVVGLGFTLDPAELEVITATGDVLTYRGGHVASKKIIERGVKGAPFCPASPVNAQVDREGGIFVYHSTAFEDEALSMPGRLLIQKVELGLQLTPGTIEYRDQAHYGLAYP